VMKGIARSKGRASGEALVSEMRFGWGYNVVTNDGGVIGAYEIDLTASDGEKTSTLKVTVTVS